MNAKSATGSILWLCLMMPGVSAHAQDGYISALFGSTTADIEGESENDTSFRIGLGFRANPNFALEGWYADYGKSQWSGTDFFIGSWSLSLETTAFIFQGVGILPLQNGVDFYGKVGIAMWDMEGCASASLLGSGCDSEDGTDIVFGMGVNIALNPRSSLRLEYELGTFSFLGSDVDMSTFMAGLNFRF